MFDILPNWHPIFVHFTVALLVVAAVLHVASHFVTNAKLVDQWATTARWNLWIGVGATLLTVAAGLYAYYTVDHDTPSHAAMTVHRNWALATTLVFLGIAGWELWLTRHGRAKSWMFTGLLAGAAGLLLTTAWHGGELVYRHGLGVMALPKVEGEGHAHEHADGAGHGDTPAAQSTDPGHHDASGQRHDDITQGDSTGGTKNDTKMDDHHDAPGAAPHTH